jgi:hypothetical protein
MKNQTQQTAVTIKAIISCWHCIQIQSNKINSDSSVDVFWNVLIKVMQMFLCLDSKSICWYQWNEKV